MANIKAALDALLKRINNDIEYLDETYADNKEPDKRSIDYEFGNHEITLGDLKTIRATLTAYAAIEPLLRGLIEARGLGTAGNWKTSHEIDGSDLPYIFAPSAENTLGPVIARFDYSREDLQFIKLAANTITAIKEILERD